MARRSASGVRTNDQVPLPKRAGAWKAARTRKMTVIEQFRRDLEDYFVEHPEEKGRTWIPRRFPSVRDCVRYYGWLRTNKVLMPPKYRVVTRGCYAYHTITDNGRCWETDGSEVPLPLWWRKEQAKEAEWQQQSSQFSSSSEG